MAFKENILKKIAVDRMARMVGGSIGSPESGRKIDKEAMRRLLAESPYTLHKTRDLELYTHSVSSGPDRILVLDNELPLYQTTIDDVALRKSPTLKEMVKIRNIIKILNDKDVVVAKREAALEIIRRECVERLDLSFTAEDIDAIAADGSAALKRDFAERVTEALTIFGEILGYEPAPPPFNISKCDIIGHIDTGENGEVRFGPAAAYNRIHNRLKWIEDRMKVDDKVQFETYYRIVAGDGEGAAAGEAVFDILARAVKARGVNLEH